MHTLGYSAVGLSSSHFLEFYTEAQRCIVKGDVLVERLVSKRRLWLIVCREGVNRLGKTPFTDCFSPSEAHR